MTGLEIFTRDRTAWGHPYPGYRTKRCEGCRWPFQCYEACADRIYCRACESKTEELLR